MWKEGGKEGRVEERLVAAAQPQLFSPTTSLNIPSAGSELKGLQRNCGSPLVRFPPFFLYLRLSCWSGTTERKSCPTLNPGRLIFLAKAAIITRQRLTKLFRLGWAIRAGGAANGERITQTFPPLAPIYSRKFTGSVRTSHDFIPAPFLLQHNGSPSISNQRTFEAMKLWQV